MSTFYTLRRRPVAGVLTLLLAAAPALAIADWVREVPLAPAPLGPQVGVAPTEQGFELRSGTATLRYSAEGELLQRLPGTGFDMLALAAHASVDREAVWWQGTEAKPWAAPLPDQAWASSVNRCLRVPGPDGSHVRVVERPVLPAWLASVDYSVPDRASALADLPVFASAHPGLSAVLDSEGGLYLARTEGGSSVAVVRYRPDCSSDTVFRFSDSVLGLAASGDAEHAWLLRNTVGGVRLQRLRAGGPDSEVAVGGDAASVGLVALSNGRAAVGRRQGSALVVSEYSDAGVNTRNLSIEVPGTFQWLGEIEGQRVLVSSQTAQLQPNAVERSWVVRLGQGDEVLSTQEIEGRFWGVLPAAEGAAQGVLLGRYLEAPAVTNGQGPQVNLWQPMTDAPGTLRSFAAYELPLLALPAGRLLVANATLLETSNLRVVDAQGGTALALNTPGLGRLGDPAIREQVSDSGQVLISVSQREAATRPVDRFDPAFRQQLFAFSADGELTWSGTQENYALGYGVNVALNGSRFCRLTAPQPGAIGLECHDAESGQALQQLDSLAIGGALWIQRMVLDAEGSLHLLVVDTNGSMGSPPLLAGDYLIVSPQGQIQRERFNAGPNGFPILPGDALAGPQPRLELDSATDSARSLAANGSIEWSVSLASLGLQGSLALPDGRIEATKFVASLRRGDGWLLVAQRELDSGNPGFPATLDPGMRRESRGQLLAVDAEGHLLWSRGLPLRSGDAFEVGLVDAGTAVGAREPGLERSVTRWYDADSGLPLNTTTGAGGPEFDLLRDEQRPGMARAGQHWSTRLQLDVDGPKLRVSRSTIAPERINLPLRQAALAGVWYDPATSGQGLLLDASIDGDYVFGAWFATNAGADAWGFSPNSPNGTAYSNVHPYGWLEHLPGLDFAQRSSLRWYSFLGDLDSGEGVLYRSSTAAFAVDAEATTTAMGVVKLELIGCDRLRFTYTLDGRPGVGSNPIEGPRPSAARELVRLGARRAPCIAAGSPDSEPEQPAQHPVLTGAGFHAASSGSWYNPAQSGQGLLFEVLPPGRMDGQDYAGQLAGAWFTFDPAGRSDDADSQHWFSLLGSLQPNASGTAQLTILRTLGGVFDAAPTQNTYRVGTAELVFASCDRAVLRYHFDADAGWAGDYAGRTGEIPLQRFEACAQP